MNVLFLLFLSLTSCGPESPDGGGSVLISTLYFMFLAFFVYYMIVIKPAQIEAEEQKKFVDALSKGQEVVTSGGLVGKYVQKKGEIVTIEVGQKMQLRVLATEIKKRETSAETSEQKAKG